MLARPSTLTYRASKFVRRNRLAVTAAALVLLTLFAGFGVSLRQYRNAQRERIKEEAVNAYLQKMLLSTSPGSKGVGGQGVDTTINDALDVATSELENEDLSAQPEVKAQLQQIIGAIYLAQGRYKEAETLLRAAMAAQTSLYGNSSPETLETMADLSTILLTKADYDTADQVLRDILPKLREGHRQGKINPESLQNVLNNFAVLQRAKGESSEAEQLLREAVGLRASLPAETQSATRRCETVLVLTLLDQGKFDEAESFARELVAEFRRMPDTKAPEMCSALTILGSVLMEQNKLDEAEPVLLASYESLKLSQAGDNPRASLAKRRLLELYTLWGKPGMLARYR